MIEIQHEGGAAASTALLISCSPADGVSGVGRSVDLALSLGHTRVVVDLGERSDADAEFLSALHRSARRARAAGARLAVVCADGRLRRLFDLTLLSEGFGVYATREEALAA